MAEQVIVIGGGLAGLSAAHNVLEHGGRVMLLDKCPFLGGNSTKATSGINGALTRTQAKACIEDSADKFEADIIRGAAGVGHTSAPAHTIPLAKVRDPPPGGAGLETPPLFPNPEPGSRDISTTPAPPPAFADRVPARIAQVLAQGSGSSVDWLVEKFGLDLSLLSQLGARPSVPNPTSPQTQSRESMSSTGPKVNIS